MAVKMTLCVSVITISVNLRTKQKKTEKHFTF